MLIKYFFDYIAILRLIHIEFVLLRLFSVSYYFRSVWTKFLAIGILLSIFEGSFFSCPLSLYLMYMFFLCKTIS